MSKINPYKEQIYNILNRWKQCIVCSLIPDDVKEHIKQSIINVEIKLASTKSTTEMRVIYNELKHTRWKLTEDFNGCL